MQEPELESFLLRVVPNLAADWAPALPWDIEELEDRVALTGYEIPGCHWWFLSKMGGDVGALRPALGGYTAERVLHAYDNMAMLAQSTLGAQQTLVFRVAGASSTQIREVLDQLSTHTKLQVDAGRWMPPR